MNSGMLIWRPAHDRNVDAAAAGSFVTNIMAHRIVRLSDRKSVTENPAACFNCAGKFWPQLNGAHCAWKHGHMVDFRGSCSCRPTDRPIDRTARVSTCPNIWLILLCRFGDVFPSLSTSSSSTSSAVADYDATDGRKRPTGKKMDRSPCKRIACVMFYARFIVNLCVCVVHFMVSGVVQYIQRWFFLSRVYVIRSDMLCFYFFLVCFISSSIHCRFWIDIWFGIPPAVWVAS